MAKATDRYVLAAVAVVGIIAIFVMASTASSPVTEEKPTFAPPENTVGQAILRPGVQTGVIEREGKHDFNSDGILNDEDAKRLADAIDAQKCPYGFDCDLNNDNRLDIYDLGQLNAMIVDAERQAVVDTPTPQTPKRYVSQTRLRAVRRF